MTNTAISIYPAPIPWDDLETWHGLSRFQGLLDSNALAKIISPILSDFGISKVEARFAGNDGEQGGIYDLVYLRDVTTEIELSKLCIEGDRAELVENCTGRALLCLLDSTQVAWHENSSRFGTISLNTPSNEFDIKIMELKSDMKDPVELYSVSGQSLSI